ncbi:MAG: DUF1523 family protein [Rhodobacter sp.]|nr:DUF1523 family protein [Rhodobacter sp.]MCY4243577.1 DUF1523 family protein [Rhodobacter sp.]
MRAVWISLRAVIVVLALALLHYALPQHDVARITSTEVIRMDFSSVNRVFYAQSDSASAEHETRDVRLINTQRRKSFLLGFIRRDAEGVMVYRNEDTGWIWPPYFKFDSSDLQAVASSNMSVPGLERWVVITHYGWRNRFLSIYPNAVGIRPVNDPDVVTVPWFNIFFLAFLAFGYFLLRAMWRQFRRRATGLFRLSAGAAAGRVRDWVGLARGRLLTWLESRRWNPWRRNAGREPGPLSIGDDRERNSVRSRTGM